MNEPSVNPAPQKGNFLALTPLLVFVGLFFAASVALGDFYKVPLAPLFILASVYAVAIARGLPLGERIKLFSRGAGDPGMMLMVWIFVLAGAFAASAKAMGGIDATVQLIVALLPGQWLLPGMFFAACFVSLSIGTSVGCIVALVPVAAGIAVQTGISLPLMTAAVVGGSFFGDNLSFISDTTVVSTRSQGCSLSDKFKVNFRIVLPAAVLTFVLYAVLGYEARPMVVAADFSRSYLVLPYLAVLFFAMLGMNVLTVLVVGNVLTGVVGMAGGCFDMQGWLQSSAEGIAGMGELMLISMLAGGMLEMIKYMGGINYMMRMLTRHVSGRRAAELSIGVLVGVTNVFTANNTVAILSVGAMAREISERFGIDPRKSASLLDTFSCMVQGLLPYGAQLLMAGGLAAISPMEVIPYLYYPLLMGGCALMAIWLRYPRKYAGPAGVKR